MTSPTETLSVNSAAELLEYVELKGIIVYEVHGLRGPRPDAEDEHPDVSISVQERHDDNFIEPRFRMIVTDGNAQYTVDVGTRYEMSQPVRLAKAVLKEFIERVAVMAAFPFLRESIATTAARMELGVPVLGLLRAGSFSLDEDDI